jgi:hypothetical protein
MLSESRILLMVQVSSKTVTSFAQLYKTEGKAALPKAVHGERHSPLGS